MFGSNGSMDRKAALAQLQGSGLRVRERISRPTEVVEAPGWQGARRAHTRRYATDEQRSRTGWIGGVSDRLILSRTLRTEILDAALHAFQVAWNDPPRIDNGVTVKVTKKMLMVVDYTLPGTQERFWLFDLASMQLRHVLHCSHGKKSQAR
jgi:hypothetical protein